MRRAVSVKLTTFLTTVKYYKTATRIGSCTDRLHCAAACIGTVTGIHIHVYTPKTKRAMVARGKAKCLDLAVAVQAGKAAVVF